MTQMILAGQLLNILLKHKRCQWLSHRILYYDTNDFSGSITRYFIMTHILLVASLVA